MEEITLEQVQQYFEANADSEDVQKFVSSFITPDHVTAFLDSDEGKKIVQPRLDQHFTKGLETWKANNLEKLIEEEIAKRFPEETEDQKTLRKLQADLEAEKQARIRESLRNKAMAEATKKGLPLDLIDFFVGNDEETTAKNLETFLTTWTESLSAAVEERFKEGGRTPKGGSGGAGGGSVKRLTREQIENMSPDEINANWDAIQEALSGGVD